MTYPFTALPGSTKDLDEKRIFIQFSGTALQTTVQTPFSRVAIKSALPYNGTTALTEVPGISFPYDLANETVQDGLITLPAGVLTINRVGTTSGLTVALLIGGRE